MELPPKAENKNELSKTEVGFEEQAILGVNEYLQKEAERTGEKFPSVYIKFFSGPHGTEYDARGIPKELEGADIYIPEYDGYTEEVLQEFNDVSFGKKAPDSSNEIFNEGFDKPILEALASSGKPVVIVDLPKEELQKYKNDNEIWNKRKYLDTFEYEEALEEVKARMKHISDFDLYREEYMRRALGPKVAEALRSHPKLCEKEKVTVLMTLGGSHTDIYHRMKKMENNFVSRKINAMYFSHKNEGIQRFTFGKEVNDELAGKALVQEILNWEEYFKKLGNITKDSVKLEKIKRVLEEVVGSETREVFEKWRKSGQERFEAWQEFLKEHGLKAEQWMEVRKDFEKWQKETSRDTHDFSKYFDAKLFEKGIKIPENEKELDELLAQKYGAKTVKEL